MSKLLLSNRIWFLRYSRLRTTIFIITVAVIASNGFGIMVFSESTSNILLIVSTALLLTTLLFDYFQQPSFLEIVELDEALLLKLYQPDLRYLIYLKESAIRSLSAKKGDQLIFRKYKGFIPLLDRIDFILTRKNGETWKTNTINIGWQNERELIKFKKQLDIFNRHHTGYST